MQEYINRLETTVGTPEFEEVYAEVCGLKREDVNAITSKFVSHTARTAPKRRSLERIYARHVSLIDSKNKREWQRGKSAA